MTRGRGSKVTALPNWGQHMRRAHPEYAGYEDIDLLPGKQASGRNIVSYEFLRKSLCHRRPGCARDYFLLIDRRQQPAVGKYPDQILLQKPGAGPPGGRKQGEREE